MSRWKNDMICRTLQKVIYKKIYKGHRPNEWKPWKESSETVLENGVVCRNDLKYSEHYPNSFLDIWYPDASGRKRPVVVYFHGGGFIFGDKTTGDPLAAGSGGSGKLMEIVRAGYILVNGNYALAPEYRFPSQIQQVDELFCFLMEHAEELHLDMSRVCLSGGSAGADLTEIYGTCVCSVSYAKKLGVTPVMTRDNLKVLVVDEAALDASVFDGNMYAMLGCWTGAKKNRPEGENALINAKEFIEDTYIPTWVNASNEGGGEGFFIVEARGLKEKLDGMHVDCELVFFPGQELPHGYMDQYEKNPLARQALDSMLRFIGKYL